MVFLHSRSALVVLFAIVSAVGAIGCEANEVDGDDDDALVAAPAQATTKWSFDDGSALPAGLRPAVGEWRVEADPAAPSGPNVLRQKGRLPGATFPIAFVEGLAVKDLTVRVRCRPEAGAEDQACGLAFRLKDAQNYILTRANALEGNIRFYEVVDGVRKQLASTTYEVTAGEWHTLEATAVGDAISIAWDGKKVLSAKHAESGAGSVGLWTKADSITAFDDLEVVAR